MSYVLCVPKLMHQFSSPPQYIYIFGFGAASGLERFFFCRFLSRGREELELLLTRNVKWKPCIIEPRPCTCWQHLVERLRKYSWNIFIQINRIVWQDFATSHHNVMPVGHVFSCLIKGSVLGCREEWSLKGGYYLMLPSQSCGVHDCQNGLILLLCVALTPWTLSRNFMALNNSGEC